MKYNIAWLTLLFALTLVFSTACDPPCDKSKDEIVGDEYFTIEYRDITGVNYIDAIYNLANVSVYLDTTGGERPGFIPIKPGYENGRFGPFYYARRFLNTETDQLNDLRLFRTRYTYDYHILKDTYGTDTLTVQFLLEVDECNTFWQEIEIFKNGIPLVDFSLNQEANIVIIE